MDSSRYDTVVVGAGIVGLATAYALVTSEPSATVVVLEREPAVAAHQTGHNSGVIHSGLYYAPGSLKATLAVAGARETVEFCRQHDLPHAVPGKLVVATTAAELPRLAALASRGRANGVAVEELDPGQAREIEPEVRCLAALRIPSTGVCDFGAVAGALRDLLAARGVAVRTGARVRELRRRGDGVVAHTDVGELLADRAVACVGLRADELALASGIEPGVRIVPFRGEYAVLAPRAEGLVRHLIYPVPDPRVPFLGVHATRGADGEVHIGPNAVLALGREGYSWRRINLPELGRTLRYPGFRRLARTHWRYGVAETYRSVSRAATLRAVRRMLPALRPGDLRPSGRGVRAQAVRADGTLVDDFLLVSDGPVLHVLNAPSPAATAALPIGREIVRRLTGSPAPQPC